LIQDRDLQLWQEKEFSLPLDAAIKGLNPDYDFKFYAQYLMESNLELLIKEGNNFIERDKQEVECLVNNALNCFYTCPVTNKTYRVLCTEAKRDLRLQVAEILKEKDGVDFTLIWYLDDENTYELAMRTIKPKSEVDLSIVAANFGGVNNLRGGGHANKAGARIQGLPLQYLHNVALIDEKEPSQSPRRSLTM
jgi:nanoRNase/pAp phosphatase (c-di-AMP/oligoRNAs hydrolase)